MILDAMRVQSIRVLCPSSTNSGVVSIKISLLTCKHNR